MDEAKAKRCRACGLDKPLSEFGTYPKNGRRYPHSKCKPCLREYGLEMANAAYHRKYPEAIYCHKPRVEAETGVPVKECARCHESKPLSAFPHSSGRARSYCEPCYKAHRRERYQANPEWERAYANAHYHAKTEGHLTAARKWRAANRESQLEYSRRYNHEHRDLRHDYRVRRRAKMTPEQRQAFDSRLNRMRHHRIQAAREGKFTRAQIIEHDDWTCYLCGIRCTPANVTLDHVIPLSRGGAHSPDNLRVACRTCNNWKHKRTLEELGIA